MCSWGSQPPRERGRVERKAGVVGSEMQRRKDWWVSKWRMTEVVGGSEGAISVWTMWEQSRGSKEESLEWQTEEDEERISEGEEKVIMAV